MTKGRKPTPRDRAIQAGEAAATERRLIEKFNFPTDAGTNKPKEWITTHELARMCGVAHTTVSRWRSRKQGPRFYPMAEGTVRYKFEDVLEWLADIEGQSTDMRGAG